MLKWAVGLDMAKSKLQTGKTFIEVAVYTDMPKFPVLETGSIVMGMIMGKGCIMVTTSLSGFDAGDGNLLLLGQWRG